MAAAGNAAEARAGREEARKTMKPVAIALGDGLVLDGMLHAKGSPLHLLLHASRPPLRAYTMVLELTPIPGRGPKAAPVTPTGPGAPAAPRAAPILPGPPRGIAPTMDGLPPITLRGPPRFNVPAGGLAAPPAAKLPPPGRTAPAPAARTLPKFLAKAPFPTRAQPPGKVPLVTPAKPGRPGPPLVRGPGARLPGGPIRLERSITPLTTDWPAERTNLELWTLVAPPGSYQARLTFRGLGDAGKPITLPSSGPIDLGTLDL